MRDAGTFPVTIMLKNGVAEKIPINSPLLKRASGAKPNENLGVMDLGCYVAEPGI